MTTPIRTCSRCGCTAENLIEFHDRLLCPDCLDSMTEICVDCGTRFWHRDNCGTASSPICPDCYDRNYTRCTRCGSLISLDECWYPYDNDDPYCSDCCSDIENSPIHDYYFKPRPIFLRHRPPLLRRRAGDRRRGRGQRERLGTAEHRQPKALFCLLQARWQSG